MIVINEEFLGRRLDSDGVTQNKNPLKLGRVLIKYYKQHGLSNTEISDKLLEKIKIDKDEFGIINNYIYTSLMSTINRNGDFRNGEIPVTTTELETIRSLNNYELERFMFAMLVICRAFNNKIRLKKQEFLRLSHIKGDGKLFDECFDELHQMGYVETDVSYYMTDDNKKIEYTYFCVGDKFPKYDESEVAFIIKNTNDPVLYYLWYYNLDNIAFCEICHTPYIKSKKQTRGRDLCKYCKKKQDRDSARERMRRNYRKKKAEKSSLPT